MDAHIYQVWAGALPAPTSTLLNGVEVKIIGGHNAVSNPTCLDVALAALSFFSRKADEAERGGFIYLALGFRKQRQAFAAKIIVC